MKINIKDYSNQSSLWNSILFLCLGAILFTRAEAVLDIISIGLGVVFAVIGLTSVVMYNSNENQNKGSLFIGVILIVTSIIFIFFHNIVEQFIRFIIGGWILFNGIMRLTKALSFNLKDKNCITLLIVSILLIGIGIYTIVTANVILSTIGLIMIIYSIIEIGGFIFYSKNNQSTTETMIINETEEKQDNSKTKKKTTIKEAKIKETKKNNKKNKKKKDNN